MTGATVQAMVIYCSGSSDRHTYIALNLYIHLRDQKTWCFQHRKHRKAKQKKDEFSIKQIKFLVSNLMNSISQTRLEGKPNFFFFNWNSSSLSFQTSYIVRVIIITRYVSMARPSSGTLYCVMLIMPVFILLRVHYTVLIVFCISSTV